MYHLPIKGKFFPFNIRRLFKFYLNVVAAEFRMLKQSVKLVVRHDSNLWRG